MPADPGALDIAGLPPGDHANSVVLADPALRPLTDIFAIPAWLPMANVFSVGDVLIAVGHRLDDRGDDAAPGAPAAAAAGAAEAEAQA